MFFRDADDGAGLALDLLLALLIGAAFGALPLTVGLIRGHRQMAWTGFSVSVLVGLGCCFVAAVPAIIFTIIVAVTEPIEGRKKKKHRKDSRRRRRDRADDFLEDAEDYDDGPRRRRSRYEDDDDDYDDRPPRRKRRPRDDDSDF